MLWLILFMELVVLIVLVMFGLRVRDWFLLINQKMERISENQYSKLVEVISDKLEDRTLELQNTTSLSGLQFTYPVFFGGWSIDSYLGKFLIQYFAENKPAVILEIGSGSSTLLISRCCGLTSIKPEHIVVDHEIRYLDLTRRYAELNGLADGIKFLECPLDDIEIVGYKWYSGLKEKLGDVKIDLLLVDGPPGSVQVDSRYPAMPMLYNFLSDHCTVILDDACRPEERNIAVRWQNLYPGFSLEFLDGGHQAAILRR